MCARADMAVANDIKMLFSGIGMLQAAGKPLWTDVERICWYDDKIYAFNFENINLNNFNI